MKENIHRSLRSIYEDLQHITSYDHSLLQHSGSLLFSAEYAKYASISVEKEIGSFIDTVNAYEVGDHQQQTFAEGYPAMDIVLRHLARNHFIDADAEMTAAVEDIAMLAGQHQLMLKNYDLLYGATGMLHYLANGDSMRAEITDFYTLYISSLEENILYINNGTAWEDYYYRIREGNTGINMGLAHGVPAILKALLQIYSLSSGELRQKAKNMIDSTCSFLLHTQNHTPGALSLYGGYFIPEGEKKEISRLGWCYGDLSIAFVLYQAGKATGNSDIIARAEEIALVTTSRKESSNTMITDAGLCHGSSGVAHMYNRLWHSSGKEPFRDAADFWIQKTLDQAIYRDGVGGYKKYNPMNKGYQADYGLLEGAAGIGLALLSYITGDFGWDHCLMLNDCRTMQHAGTIR